MKKKLLFISVLFLALVGFDNKAVEASGNQNVIYDMRAEIPGKPIIDEQIPKNLNVKGFEGQVIAFYIEYTAIPAANFKLYKNGEIASPECGIELEGHKLTITIRDAKIKDSGDYRIELTNKYGSTSVTFKVTIMRDPDLNS